MSMTLDRIAKLSLWLAVFFLFLRLGGTPETPNVKPSEFFIAIAFFITLVHIFLFRTPSSPSSTQREREKHSNFTALLCSLSTWEKAKGEHGKKVFLWLGLFYASLLIGTSTSIFTFGISALPWKFIIAEYARISIATVFFLLILYHCYQNTKFTRALFLALLSPLITALIGRIPGVPEKLHMLDGDIRFEGFMGDPNYFASFTLISVVFFFALSIFKKHRFINAISLSGAVITVSAVLWSGSRSGWLGLMVALAAFWITRVRFSDTKLKTAIRCGALIFFIMLIAFILMPTGQKHTILERIGFFAVRPQQTTSETTISNNIPPGPNQISYFIHSQDRLNLWKQSIAYFTKNRLGYGPGYSKIINIQSAGEHRVAHSILFETMLVSGILGLGLLIFTGYYFVKTWLYIKNPDYIWIGTWSALVGVMVSSFFLDALSLRWLWALAALFIASHHFNSQTLKKTAAKEK